MLCETVQTLELSTFLLPVRTLKLALHGYYTETFCSELQYTYEKLLENIYLHYFRTGFSFILFATSAVQCCKN